MRLEIDVFFADTPLTDKDASEIYDACCRKRNSSHETGADPGAERIVIDRPCDQLREPALHHKDRADSPDRWIAEGDSNQPGSALVAFMADLTDRYPRLETLPDAEREESPWSGSIGETNGHALIAMGGSHCAEAVEYIMELADKHGLVCFDPKTHSILTAPPGVHLETQSGSAIWPLTMLTLLLALAGLLLLQ